MRRRILFCALALLAPVIGQCQFTFNGTGAAVFSRAKVVGAACTTVSQSNVADAAGALVGTRVPVDEKFLAMRFQASNNDTICSIGVSIFKVGSPIGTTKCELWSDNATGPVPSTKLAQTVTLDVSTLITSQTTNIVALVTPYTLTIGTYYWVALSGSGISNGDASNYLQWEASTFGGSDWTAVANDEASWVFYSGTSERFWLFRQ